MGTSQACSLGARVNKPKPRVRPGPAPRAHLSAEAFAGPGSQVQSLCEARPCRHPRG